MNFLSSADYTVVNVEGAIASNAARTDKPLTHANPAECVNWINKINGNIWNLANNHSMDCGSIGMQSTLDAAMFLNLESYTPHKATMSRKGIVSYRFDVEGQEGHSSRCVTEGANAVVDAAHKINELDKLKDDDGIPCLDSLGVEGGFSHSVKEFAKKNSLSESAKRIAAIIYFI